MIDTGPLKSRRRAFAWVGVAGSLALGLALAQAGLECGFTFWQRSFIDSFANKADAAVWHLTGLLAEIFGALAIVAYCRPLARVRWANRIRQRRFDEVGALYFGDFRYAIGQQAQALPEVAQRLTDDLGSWASLGTELSDGLALAAAKFVLFGTILWNVVPEWRFAGVWIPGPMFLFTVITCLTMLVLMHSMGRQLPARESARLEREAELRAAIARVHEHAGAIGLLDGGAAEARAAHKRLSNACAATLAAARIRSRLAAGNAFATPNDILVFLLLMPLFVQGHLTLGTVFQIALAHNGASTALGWLLAYYPDIAQFRAARTRVDELRRLLHTLPSRDRTRLAVESGPDLQIAALQPSIPLSPSPFDPAPGASRRTLSPLPDFQIQAKERVLLRAPSGFGKSVLMCILRGSWPWARGRIRIPEDAVWISQRSYFPIETLLMALSYPKEQVAEKRQAAALLEQIGLSYLVPRLCEIAPWNNVLSGGELARLALVRALLQQPGWIFMDEPTAALDPESSARFWSLVAGLHECTVVLIAHALDPAYAHWRTIQLDGSEPPSVIERAPKERGARPTGARLCGASALGN